MPMTLHKYTSMSTPLVMVNTQLLLDHQIHSLQVTEMRREQVICEARAGAIVSEDKYGKDGGTDEEGLMMRPPVPLSTLSRSATTGMPF